MSDDHGGNGGLNIVLWKVGKNYFKSGVFLSFLTFKCLFYLLKWKYRSAYFFISLYIFEFQTLSASDIRDPEISALIAAKLKEFHDLDMPGQKIVRLWDRSR